MNGFTPNPLRQQIEAIYTAIQNNLRQEVRRSRKRRYSFAAITVAVTLLFKLLLAALGGYQLQTESPFLLFFCAVTLSTWYGGLRAGALAVALSALASDYFFLTPKIVLWGNTMGQNFRLAMFAVEGLSISSVITGLQAARQQADLHRREAQQHEASWRQSEERFRLLIEGVQDYAIFALDENGCVVSWNAGAQRIKGYQPDEIIGRHFSCFYTSEDIAKGKPEEVLKIAAATGHCTDENWRVRKDGSRFWASVEITALRDEQGNLKGFSKLTRDITVRKQAEEKLQQQAEELTRANRIKDEFLAIVSHELRTPLNSILGWAQLMRSRNLNEESYRKGVETIERNAKQQVKLIDDILDVSRMIRGKIHLQVKPVNLARVLEEAIAAIRPAAEAKGIHLETAIDPSVRRVSGDSDRLEQILWNLLSNAVKFTPQGGSIFAAIERAGNQAQIRVSDTGSGIKADFLPHVFEGFRQAEGALIRTFGGLGLGLTVTRYLVELHGGTIAAFSEGEGKGATFTVKLPLATARERDLQPQRANFGTETSPNNLWALDGLRVLVVDDDDDTRELIATVLSQYGVEVTAASSAPEALLALESVKPDLLVSDIGMPGENGYQLMQKIRQIEAERGGEIRAIALTAFSREEDRSQAMQAGFQMHVAKPVEPSQLATAVASLAGQE